LVKPYFFIHTIYYFCLIVNYSPTPKFAIIMSQSVSIDDYLPCSSYEGTPEENGMRRFSEGDKFYFSLIDEGQVVLRSEGYVNEAGRENGIASVLKNMVLEERYSTIQLADGTWVLSLKAGNHQEIAQSCPFATEAEARAMLPSERAKAAEARRLAALAAAAAATTVAASDDSDRLEDDYMICREYEEKMSSRSEKYPDFITFQHENTGKYYFAWVTDDDKIILRSEGYPTVGARDNGLESVRKNREIKERYKVEQVKGAYFLTLKAGNHQEIGRSCPKDSEAALWALVPFFGAGAAGLGGAAVGAAALAGAAAMASKVDMPDLGAAKSLAADADIPAAAIGDIDAGGGGFNWKWLLIPLLLGLLFWLWRSCSKPKVEAEVPVAAIDTLSAKVDTATMPEPAAPATTEATPDCNLNWILFDFDKYDIRSDANAELQGMANILKQNASYKGILKAYTDSRGSDTYNQKLSENRAAAAEAVLVAAGIEASRIEKAASSETAPVASNTKDDSGRKFNRRVELYVVDASGKEVCKSIAPEIPTSLKQ
jgi:outer membrane protein OmpA-like peptidoglycan-associated protein/uncharacterized protein YegP (UPF0339 family)